MPKTGVTKTEHPHVERRKGVCGGSPVITRTRIPVRLIVSLPRQGESVEEIVEAYPQLTRAQVYDALSYAYDHQDEIAEEFRQNSLEYVLQKNDMFLDDRGVIRPKPRAR